MNTMKKFLHDRRLLLAQLTVLAFALLAIVGAYRWFSYSQPMLAGNYPAASESLSADRAVALYDAAVVYYQNEKFDVALKILDAAYTEVSGPGGEIPADRKKLAAEIKFLAGNALVKTKQLSKAVEAYKEALRLDPTNLYAKYNLELLQQMNGGKGPGDEPGGSGPGKGGKKGI